MLVAAGLLSLVRYPGDGLNLSHGAGACMRNRFVAVSMYARKKLTALSAPPFRALRQRARSRAAVDARESVRIVCAGGALAPEVSTPAVKEVQLMQHEAVQ